MFLTTNRQDATANVQERQRVQAFFKQSLENTPNNKKTALPRSFIRDKERS